MPVITSAGIRMKAGHDAAQPVSPVTGSKKLTIAGDALDDEVGGGKVRIRAGGRHKADGLSAWR